MKKSNLLILFFTLILINGCGVKTLNKDFKDYVKRNYVEQNEKERNYLKNQVHENIVKKRYIDLSIKKSISTVLKELSEIDGNIYIFKGEDIDITPCTNSQKLGINSFEKLNQYIKDTTNLTLVITKNRFLKNRAKVVELKDLHSLESNLNKIPFYLKGSVYIDDALEEMSKITGFSIIYQIDSPSSTQPNTQTPYPAQTSSVNSFFEGKYTSFSGNNIADFLNLLSNNFNLFVDIDYKNKLIKFSKRKSKIYHIFVNNINMSGSLSGEKSATGVDSGGSSNLPITSQITINILGDLENNIKKIISGDPNSILSFNKTSGQLFVKTDKRRMESVTKLINDFNSIFNKQIDFQLDIYEFAVTKNFSYGVAVGGKVSVDGYTVDTNGKTTNIVNSIFKITKKNGDDFADVESTNEIVQLLKNTNHGYIIKNNMPYMIDLTTSKNYIKTITTTVNNTVSGATQVTTPETATISEGTVLTVLARILGKRVELNIEPNMVTIDSIKPKEFENNSISLPEVSTTKFKSNITILDGERRIIGYITKYQDASNYNGILPINHFIIGGKNGKKYIRKEIVFVVGVKIRK